MNDLARIIIDDGGEEGDGLWHLVQRRGGGEPVIFCTGEVYGFGEGDARAEFKTTKRGGIECNHCLGMIKEIKAVKL